MTTTNTTPDYPENPHVLIDADILTYSIPYMFMEEAEEDVCLQTLDKKINEIIEKTKAETYQLYLTGKGNFRNKIATTAPYKGQRKKEKPTHYQASRDYMVKCWDAVVIDGMEADDAIAIYATQNEDCVIASLDKDTFMVGGWKYKWSVGDRPNRMWYATELGSLELNSKRKLVFDGLKGFYAQMILGDKVDEIQGLKGKGDVFTYNNLKDLNSDEKLLSCVMELYEVQFPGKWKERFLENADLLWMVRELDSNGEPITWSKMNSHRLK